MHGESGYGLWPLVIINTVIFVFFAASLFHPRTKRDWRAMGMYSGFIVALFVEMYGFPLSIYLITSVVGSQFPGLSMTHASGHLWNDLIGWSGDPHLSPFHIASYAAIGGGFWLIASAWQVLFQAQRTGKLATTGLYARVQHPQYDGLLLIMVGFLLQWPTIPTLILFPVMVYIYSRLARSEAQDVAAAYPDEWQAWARVTPRFVPHRKPSTKTREQG